jgi:DNA-binding transcriptional MerR regulator
MQKMKKLYTIGEMSKIMGVSIQTLRYYSKIGLVKPAFINSSTRYRYYSFNQMHFIDRIKYLQKLGLHLTEIKHILDTNDISLLLNLLDVQEKTFREKIRHAEGSIDGIRWYRDYFTYVDSDSLKNNTYCYTLKFEPRYLLAVPCLQGEPKEDYHIRLSKLKNSKDFKELSYQRQFAPIIDYESLLKNQLNLRYYGIFLKKKPAFMSEHILEIPSGQFLCFKARIVSEGWNPSFIKFFFKNKPKPSIVVASEYENSLIEYSRSVYEVQTFISSESL